MRNDAELARPSDSLRDPETLRDRIHAWLSARVADPVIDEVHPPTGNGMSSETILFDATWDGSSRSLVMRVAPLAAAQPVFPSYDMEMQSAVLRAAAPYVPTPAVYWTEPDPAHLGAPFFVMQRVDGLIPPDVMPYNFGSWVTEATDAQRELLESSTVRMLAALHAAPVSAFDCLGPSDDALRRHVAGQREYYEWVVAGGPRSPLIDRCFGQLTLPAVSRTVVSWGDARIGNVVYRDFQPVAVLDWEMASFGPPELDLGWMIFLHKFFEDIAAPAGLPGLPDFFRRDRVAARYAEASGYEPRDLDFFVLYAALRHAIVMFRVQSRAIHFGQAQPPDDPDDMILHRRALEAML